MDAKDKKGKDKSRFNGEVTVSDSGSSKVKGQQSSSTSKPLDSPSRSFRNIFALRLGRKNSAETLPISSGDMNNKTKKKEEQQSSQIDVENRATKRRKSVSEQDVPTLASVSSKNLGQFAKSESTTEFRSREETIATESTKNSRRTSHERIQSNDSSRNLKAEITIQVTPPAEFKRTFKMNEHSRSFAFEKSPRSLVKREIHKSVTLNDISSLMVPSDPELTRKRKGRLSTNSPEKQVNHVAV